LLLDEVQSSSIGRLWSGDAEQKTTLTIIHYHLKARTGWARPDYAPVG